MPWGDFKSTVRRTYFMGRKSINYKRGQRLTPIVITESTTAKIIDLCVGFIAKDGNGNNHVNDSDSQGKYWSNWQLGNFF